MGLPTVAVFAEPDVKAHHPTAADEAFLIPPSPEHKNPIAPYLDIEAILKICKENGVKAVHPGYGFLAENVDFARRCGEEGVTFVGPRPEHLDLFGDKTKAREFAIRANVPVLPGSGLCRSLEEARAFLGANEGVLRWPVLIKAAFGGGGRGQKVVQQPEDFDDSFQRCSQEALLGFGDGGCFVEEFLVKARHIEVQVIGDGKGRCVHFFERDCSVQQRNQKVVEIAPARAMDPELRARITGAAVRLCEPCQYLNAGTVEFLVTGPLSDPNSRFVFLEMNPRIQVEHTITEQVTGVDLVQAQLRVAAGMGFEALAALPPPAPRGWAIQARVTLLPGGAGLLARYAEPAGPGVRVDSGVAQGVMVPAEYDPMILKVICSVDEGQTFDACVERLLEALSGLELEGIKVNKEMLGRILRHELFVGNEIYTSFLNDQPEVVTGKPAAAAAGAAAGQRVRVEAPFHGQVSEIRVKPGDRVRGGTAVLVINAMKMLNDVQAGVSGEVKEVLVGAEQQVAEGQALVVIEASGEQDAEDEGDAALQPRKRERPARPAAPGLVQGDAAAAASRRLASTWYAAGGAAGPTDPSSPIIRSRVKRDDTFTKRLAHNLRLIEDLRAWTAWAHGGGGAGSVEAHRARGKMLPRERIQHVIDPGTEFMEITPLAAWGRYNNEVPSGGVVAGIGIVHGRECIFIGNDPTVKGGAIVGEGARKYARAQEVADMNRLPCVYLVDQGAGAGGGSFKSQAIMSAKQIPQVACVLGKCTGGAAYIPALCDESVIVKGNGMVYAGDAAGEGADEQDLGGAAMHTSKSGVIDHLAETEEEAMLKVRTILGHLAGRRPKAELFGMVEPEEPLYDPEELLGILPEDTKIPFDVREVVARIVDGSRFHEFKPRYGATLVCGFAHIDGYPVGILGNNGMLFSESAIKATHFVQICGQRGIPLVFLHNITGFIIGTEYERGGITKDGAKMITAVSCVPVPKFCVVLAGSHGAGNYAMNGPAYDPRFTWLWPNAKISVMGGEQAAGVITYVKDRQRKREGLPPLSKEELEAMKAPIVAAFEANSSAYHSTSAIFDDGIIDPRDTRKYLARGISVALNAPAVDGQYGVFRM
uniref:Acetyl-CoA carboxylase n=1 Tax=Pyrodinium bahamense TaxID=73915 RepID=A0A7S0AU43_9DINO